MISTPQTPSTEVSTLPHLVKKTKDKELHALHYQLAQQDKTI